MASIISAGTSTGTALNLTGDTSGILQLASNNGTVGLTVDASQNVGIGITNPAAKLHTVGEIYAAQATANSQQIRLSPQATDANIIYSTYNGTNSYLPLAFNVGGAERIRITSAGRLGVGTATPVSLLEVAGTATAQYFNVPSGSGYNSFQMGADSYGPGWYVYDLTNNAYRIIVNNTGNVQLQKNLSLGNVTPTTSGTGITFPATQNASSDANTLDDYEEGTFTVTDASGAGLTFTNNTGRYVKVGGLVYFAFDIIFPTTANATNIQIGIPFTSGSSTSFSAAVGYSNSGSVPTAYIPPLGGTVRLYNTAGAAITNATFSGKEVAISGCYPTT